MPKASPFFLIALLAAILGGCQQIGTGLAIGPYTCFSSPSTAKVSWIMAPGADADSQITVDQGAKATIETKPVPGQKEIIHLATITNLRPGLTYRYKILFSRDGKPVGEAPGEFQSAPVPGDQTPIRFVVYGDTRSFPQRHHEVSSGIDNEGHLAFIVQSGDFCSNGDVWPLWKREYFDPAKDMLTHTTLWAALGNHEQNGFMAKTLFDLSKSYYSFDYGNIHWCVIDSELAEEPGELKSNKADPEMLAWLEKDLAASHATWKFVSYHRPTFDIITHRTTWGQSDLLPILEKGGVDIVFSGHTHNYQRFVPIGSEGKKPVIFVVSAGGGAPNYQVNPAPILEKGYSGLHYCVLSVNGNNLEFTAKYPDGSILDHMTLAKTNGVYQKEVMDKAVTTTYAEDSSFLLTGLYARSSTPPVPGQPFKLKISPDSFPEGAIVEISSAAPPLPHELEPGEIPHGQWTIPTVTLTQWTGHAGVDEAAGALEFHIAVTAADLGGEANLAAAKDSLQNNGPRKEIPIATGGTARWYVIDPNHGEITNEACITDDLDDETFVLGYNDADHSITHRLPNRWNVTAGNPVSEPGGVMLPFTLDGAGGEYMDALTRANKGRPLVMLLDDRAIWDPVIQAVTRDKGVISFGKHISLGEALDEIKDVKRLMDGHRNLVPLTITAIPPADMKVTMKGFTPSIRTSLKVTYQGKTYTTDSAGVFFYSTDLKAWQRIRAAETGEPLPVDKPAAKPKPKTKPAATRPSIP